MSKPQCIDLELHADDRGYFIPLTNSLPPKLNAKIKRTYVVGNFAKGVIRGFHFHRKEIKIFHIARGAAKFISINPKSPKKDVHVFVISDKKPSQVIIPPGYANGWMSLADNTILVASSTSTFAESVKDDTRYDPFKWGDLWAAKGR